MSATNRKVHVIENSDKLLHQPGIGSIIVPMNDIYYHKKKGVRTLSISDIRTRYCTDNNNKPTLVLEFITDQQPDVAQFTQSWLNQIEEGLIEIVDR